MGRGGYVQDYEVLDVDAARWDGEPEASARALLDLWSAGGGREVSIEPPPRTRPHPPLLLATSSDKGIAFAATRGLPLQHYFASPASARVSVEARYDELGGDRSGDPTSERPAHLHTLIVVVADDAGAARERLAAALAESFMAGDHPTVPGAADRHRGPDGKPIDRTALAGVVAQGAIVGPPGQVVDELGSFVEQTGARRLAIYHEAVADADLTLSSLERFAAEVAPQLVETVARPIRAAST